jgi:hypothetical protein
MRYGKVNQHFNPAIGKWASDPDGVAWAWTYEDRGVNWWGDRKLEYCKRFFPNTTSVRSIWNVTINDWKAWLDDRQFYKQTVEWRECVQTTWTRGTLSGYTFTWTPFTWTIFTWIILTWIRIVPSRTNTVPKDPSGKVIPAIAMWPGKVNQHFNPTVGKWATDPDGIAGWEDFDVNNPASSNQWNNRKVEYCKKFFPKTIAVKSIWNVTINDWKARENTGSYFKTVEWRQCVEWTIVNPIPFPFSWTWSISITYNSWVADNILIPSVSKTFGTVDIVAKSQDMKLQSLYLKIESSEWIPLWLASSLLSDVSLVYRWFNSDTTIIEWERMSSAPWLNDIIVFENIDLPVMKKWQKNTFTIRATINKIDLEYYNNTNFINLKLATSFDHPTNINDANGVEMIGISSAGYIKIVGVPTKTQFSNNHLIAWTHPKVQQIGWPSLINLIQLRITNQNYPITVSSIDYFATAENPSDIEKPFTIYDWSKVLAKGTLIAGKVSKIIFTSPLTIYPWQRPEITVKLDSPFVNTVPYPTPKQRIFKIENITYTQKLPNITDVFVTQPSYYLKSIGLPISASY